MQKSLITSLTTLSNITYHFWTMNQVIVLLLFSMIFIFDVLIFVSLRKRSFSYIIKVIYYWTFFSFSFHALLAGFDWCDPFKSKSLRKPLLQGYYELLFLSQRKLTLNSSFLVVLYTIIILALSSKSLKQ